MKRFLASLALSLLALATVMCGGGSKASNSLSASSRGDAGHGHDGSADGGSGGFGNPGADATTSDGGCGPMCVVAGAGPGTSAPFNLTTNENSGVGLDPDGGLILDPSSNTLPSIIWIANTGAGTVTKTDTNTFQVLGQYAIGPSANTLDPSRTSVNSDGDVFVGNRAGGMLLKISSAGAGCPDTNMDGKITTSTGFGNILPWGQDDCVLWNVPVPAEAMVRGVAAQDVEVSVPVPDAPNNTVINHYVWTGGTTAPYTIHKYDGATGAQLISTAAPSAIYGLALSGTGQLWMSGNTDGPTFSRVDTTKCVDQASCDAAEICQSSCDSTGACTCTSCNSGPCDQAIKERITIPDAVYGITVDFKQRVWLGGSDVKRYDPSAPAASRYSKVGTGASYYGVTADSKGFVWAAGTDGSSVVRVVGDTLQSNIIQGIPSKGLAVDKQGKIWSISLNSGASVITPGPTLTDNPVASPPGGNTQLTGADAPAGIGYCYTYSDMTGQQLALAADKPGYYRQIFTGCGTGATTWFDLSWTASTPANTHVMFLGRTAMTQAGLATAPWITLADTISSTSPVALGAAFNGPVSPFLEIEVELFGFVGLTGLVSPTVSGFSVDYTCNVGPN
jgi:hypothetical protein